MKRFPDKLIVTPADKQGYWIIEKPFRYIPSKHLKINTITIPAGFKTNFASVPRIFRNIIQQWGKHGNAAIVHDYLYTANCKPFVSRKTADKIFLNAMKFSKVGFFKRQLMYRTVRLFGAMNWKGESL